MAHKGERPVHGHEILGLRQLSQAVTRPYHDGDFASIVYQGVAFYLMDRSAESGVTWDELDDLAREHYLRIALFHLKKIDIHVNPAFYH